MFDTRRERDQQMQATLNLLQARLSLLSSRLLLSCFITFAPFSRASFPFSSRAKTQKKSNFKFSSPNEKRAPTHCTLTRFFFCDAAR